MATKKPTAAKKKALAQKLAKIAERDSKTFRKMAAAQREKMHKRISKMAKLNARIAAADKVASELKKLKTEVELRLVKMFRTAQMQSLRLDSGAVAFLRTVKFPTIKNRAKLDQYILKHKALDLLQNRITQKAYFDRLEDGDTVPGVEIFTRYGITVTKGKRGK